MDWLPPGIGEWTAGGILAVVVWMILTDKLVTRGRLTEARQEATLWRENAQGQQEINAEHAAAARENAKSLNAHAEAALLQEKVMRAIQEKHLQNGGDSR